jgi:hypothetical protein
MTRFEMLQRFASDERTNYKHAFLFSVFTESWINSGKPEKLEIDHEELINLSGFARNTYFKTVHKLAEYKYIDYKPATSRHAKSVISFDTINTKSILVNQSIRTNLIPLKPCINTGFVWINPAIHTELIPISQAVSTKCVPIKPVTRIRFIPIKLPISIELIPINTAYPYKFDTDKNSPKSESTVNQEDKVPIVDNFNSAEQLLVHHHHLKDVSLIFKKVDDQVIGDEKGVPGKKQPRHERPGHERPGHERRGPRIKKTPFTSSPLADPNLFRAALTTEFATADLNHYHSRLLNWRDKHGAIPERTDWLATAKTFLLNDYREGKLVTNTTIKPLTQNANRNNPRSAVIEPESTTGRSFTSW